MPQDRPRSPRPTPGLPGRTPSAAAQARLSGALRDRAEAYRQDAVIDLTMVDALLRVDEPEAAARTIDGQREALLAMARDLQVAVADAAVEREAEAVCEAAQTSLSRAPVPVRAAAGGLRRRVLAMTGAAAVVVALILPEARVSPRTTLASVQGGSTQDDLTGALDRLEAAKSWARALRAGEAAESGLPAVSQRRSATTSRSVNVLAADAPGGSAASSSSNAEVVDLEAYRSSRRAAGTGAGAGERPNASEPDEPIVDVPPAPADTIPRAGVPLITDATLVLEGGASQASLETDPRLP